MANWKKFKNIKSNIQIKKIIEKNQISSITSKLEQIQKYQKFTPVKYRTYTWTEVVKYGSMKCNLLLLKKWIYIYVYE